MKATNILDIKIGDIIQFTNSANCKREIQVTRVEEKAGTVIVEIVGVLC